MDGTEKAGGGIHKPATSGLQITALTVVKRLESIHHDILNQHHDLVTFLSKEQRDPERVTSAYQQQSRDQTPYESFIAYLSSAEGNLLKLPIEEDLSHPLSNYFISSSHNTYLTGNQLSSSSSAAGYRDVLLRGCRCVEIDVWDGKEEDVESEQEGDREQQHSFKHKILGRFRSKSKSKANAVASTDHTRPKPSVEMIEPRVLHGYTLTKEITFREVCESIRDTAFVSSELPVIVSLEVHADLQQQAIMVDIITQVWKGMLVTLPDASPEHIEGLPPPSELRKKLLIKVKYTQPEKVKRRAEEEETGNKKNRERSSSNLSSSSEEETEQTKDEKPKKKKMLDSLSSLGIYTRSHHFKSFDQAEAKLPSHIFSLSEGAVSEAHETNAEDLFKHNQRYFMRTYPKGTRISSSNLNPALFWRQGVQIVALNWQKCDKGVMLNEAMFAGTGGWVLKPEAYRSSSLSRQRSPSLLPPMLPDAVTPTGRPPKLLDLTIHFLAAQNIPVPSDGTEKSFRPYIKCTLHTETLGSSLSGPRRRGSLQRRRSSRSDRRVDKTSKLKQTTISAASKTNMKGRTETKRGCSPDLGDESLHFKDVPIDEEALSFLRFKIEDDIEFRPDTTAAWACFRLDRINQGLRVVRLFDKHGKLTDGFLLVKITKSLREEVNAPQIALPMR